MPTEEEKRKHRCCFSGHRPEKLNEDEATVKAWLTAQIKTAISLGYTTFISGCAMGTDLWAGHIVLKLRDEEKVKKGSSALRLIAATPWPGFSNRWAIEWQQQYSDLLKNADLVVPVSKQYFKDVFQKRNEWMVDHSSRVIAYYNGSPGSTRNTIEYAEKKGIEVITNNPDYKPKPDPLKTDYPENLLTDIGLELMFEDGKYIPINEDQMAGLERALSLLRWPEREVAKRFYDQKQPMEIIAEQLGHSTPWAQMHGNRAIRKLRSETDYIKDGYEKTELKNKIACADEMKKQLRIQQKKHPLMYEEDIVEFVFQGMLGVGHLIASADDALKRLEEEYDEARPDASEPLTEKISQNWVRLNLRPAKAKGINVEDIANYLYESSCIRPLSFTRQNVYNFCVKAYPIETMKIAAAKVLDENWLPSHSDPYRETYKPSYRVLYKDYKKFKREEL